MPPLDPCANLPDAAEFDPVSVTLLRTLHGVEDKNGKALAGLSLARLAKRTGLRQSTLRDCELFKFAAALSTNLYFAARASSRSLIGLRLDSKWPSTEQNGRLSLFFRELSGHDGHFGRSGP